ncbi:hypothetical protein F5J12DRAFT_856217 [Pisolithus orientalis]|uniref:uncharacterized protein n=1 Tax=Pisolithus orientalis TaxID=936130 RepID=UPI00222559B5|nr:uncharacterized protein F5J12DRAFT_856217 [Pisolithus orientalis]KAI5995337.1 hypothetical protein F5J12DRAFT_856217 [Pisolithus orientalis]
MVNFVLDFAERLLALSAEDDAAPSPLVASYLSLLLLSHLTTFVERTKGYQDISTPLTQRQIGLLALPCTSHRSRRRRSGGIITRVADSAVTNGHTSGAGRPERTKVYISRRRLMF